MAIRKTWNGSEWITNGQSTTSAIRYDVDQSLTDSEKLRAQKNIGTEIETNISSTSTNSKVAGAKAVYDYHDDTKYDASNPAGYTSNTGTVTSVAVSMNGLTKGTVTTSGTIDLGTVITSHQDISGKEDKSNKVTSIDSSSTDTQYPSAKAVYSYHDTNKEDVSNKVTTITQSSTDTQYPTAKLLYDTRQDLKEIAEGKTKSYVVSKVTNPSFDVQTSSIEITTFTTTDGVTHSFTELKLGDNLYVVETDVPDRWVSSVDTSKAVAHILETAKVPVTDVLMNGTTIVNNTIANIPLASNTTDKIGVVKVYDSGYGISIDNNGLIRINKGDWAKFNSVTPNQFQPIVSADFLLAFKKWVGGDTMTSTTSNTTINSTEAAHVRANLEAAGMSDIPNVVRL